MTSGINATREFSDHLVVAYASLNGLQRHVGDLYWPTETKASSLCSEAATVIRALWLGGGYATAVFGTAGHVFFAAGILAHGGSVSAASARSASVAPLRRSHVGATAANPSASRAAASGRSLGNGGRPMRTLPLGILLLSLAAVAMAIIGIDVMPTVLDYQTCSFFWLSGSFGSAMRSGLAAEAGCRVQLVVRHTLPCLHAWLEAAVCLERLAAVRWPHKYAVLFDRRRTLWFVAGAAVLLLIVSFVPVATHEPIDEGLCQPINVDLFELTWRRLRSLVLAAAPAAIMLPSAALVLQTLLAGGGHADVAVSQDERRASLTIVATSGQYLLGLALLAVADWSNYSVDPVGSSSTDLYSSAAAAAASPDSASRYLNAIGRLVICLCGPARFAACAALCEPFRNAFNAVLSRSSARCGKRAHRLSHARIVATAGAHDASAREAASGQGSSDRAQSTLSKSADVKAQAFSVDYSATADTESTAFGAPESTAATSTVGDCSSTVTSAMTSKTADESETEINMERETIEKDF